jgi:hypothetical protein
VYVRAIEVRTDSRIPSVPGTEEGVYLPQDEQLQSEPQLPMMDH